MKKIFFILSVVACSLTIVNCSREDDDKTGSGENNLYGTWSLDYYINDGQLVEEIVCSEQVMYVFSSNGTYSKTTFSGEGSSNCQIAVIVKGTWEGLGDNNYQLTPNGSESNDPLNITFQDNFTKFVIARSDSFTEVFTK